MKVRSEAPKGSVLAPIIFLVYVYDMTKGTRHGKTEFDAKKCHVLEMKKSVDPHGHIS